AACARPARCAGLIGDQLQIRGIAAAENHSRAERGGSNTSLRARSRFGRLREPLAQLAQLLHLLFAELGVAFREVLHCLVEPLMLVLAVRTNDTAIHDMLEQLVPGLLERRRTR